ncbi:SpaA isopeptide-forming pilin-related protein [Streptococcus hillyeri]|uniref:SpaA isopeptide-forming pilin-related protein n=1 Tax=Streptococcus hillyeri TaxID=2282420 RepID=UPI0034E2B10B
MNSLKNKLLALLGLVVFIVSGGHCFNWTSVQAESGSSQYAGRYQAYSSATADGVYKIDIAKIGNDGKLSEEMVAYCLQYAYAFPGSVNNELRPAIYDKTDLTNTDIDNFDSKKDKLNAILYYGYPTDGNHYVEDKVISATRLRALTQYAIWNVTDGKTAKDFHLSGKEEEIFNKLISGDLTAPADFKPVFFKNDRTLQASPTALKNKKYYQHLIASEKAPVSYKVFAQKRWSTAPNPLAETTVTFKLVNKDGSKAEEISDGDAEKVLTTKAKETASNVVTWENLPKHASNYKIIEVGKKEGFMAGPLTGTGREDSPYTITNDKTDTLSIPNIEVTKKWEDKAVDADNIYFGIYRISEDGSETLVTQEQIDYPQAKATFINPKKLERNRVDWKQIQLSLYKVPGDSTSERYRYVVKELRKVEGDKFIDWSYPGYETSYKVTYTAQGSMTVVTTNKQTNKFRYQFGKVGTDAKEKQLENAELRIVKVTKEGEKETTSTVDSWTTDGSLHETTLEAGTYRLIEDKAPEGYDVATISEFTVSSEGALEFTKNKDNVEVDQDKTTVQLINKKEVETSVTFKKQDSKGQALAGATLVITNPNTKETVAAFKTTDKERTLTLQPGTYTVSEEEAPANYVAVKQFNFTVNGQGGVGDLKKTYEADMITLANQTITIVDKDAQRLVLKAQKDWVNKPENTPDVYFQLIRKAGDSDTEFVEKKKLEKGQTTVEFTNLDTHGKNGIPYVYNILEVNSEGNTWQYENYTSKVIKEVDNAQAYGEGNDTWIWENTYTAPIIKVEKIVRFSKVAVNGTKELENAHLKVVEGANAEGQIAVDSKTKKELTWVSGKNQKEFTLEAGTYTMVETQAPDGFLIAEHITFTIDENGGITRTDKETVANDTIVMKDEYKRYDIEISKQNIAGNILENAKVTVRNKATGEVVSDVNGVKLENYVTTKENMKVKLEAGEYTFEENAAPAGYDVVTTFTFTVDKNGKVTTTSTEAKAKDSVLTVIDQATKYNIEISKQNLGGEELEKAEIEIFKATADGNRVHVTKWVSKKEVHKLTLEAGDYIFVENAAPAGYEKVSEIHFTVTTDGKVKVTKVGDSKEESEISKTAKVEAANENKLVVIDQATKHDIEISKQNIAGDILENATVTVRNKKTNDVVSDVNGAKLENYVTTKDNMKVKLEAGEYTFEENAAPAGYDVVTTFTFTVDKDGKVTTTSTEAKVKDSVLTVIDQATKYNIEISKQNLGGEELEKAEIEIFKATADGNRVHVTKWVSKKEVHKLTLEAGDYIFVENAAPAGYEKVSNIHFTVTADGMIKVTKVGDLTDPALMSNTAEVVTMKGNKLVVTDQAKQHDIEISKQNLGGEELENAKIEIFKATEKGEKAISIADWTSTKESHKLTLEAGDYIFVENAAPAGYEKVTDIHFTVTVDGKVNVTKVGDSTKQDDMSKTAKVDAEKANKLIVIDQATKHDVVISKVNLDGKELEGAEIEISKDGKVVESWKSEKTAKTIKFTAGDYIFHEKAAPKGYKVVTDITFNVSEEGKVTVVKTTTSGKAEVVDNKLVVTDEAEEPKAQEVIISKVDIAGQEVEGAFITIYNELGHIADNRIREHDPAEWTSKKGQVFKLKLLPGTYTFEEKVAPKGLQKVTKLKFTVDAQGKVAVVSKGVNDDATEAKSEVKDDNKLIVTDMPETKDVVISKVNLGGEELEGAEIEISKDGKVVEKWTSEKTAKTIKLEAGDYIFHEKVAPNGYLKVTDITFTVSEDGQVTVKDAAGNKVDSTDNKLVVTDQVAPTTETSTTASETTTEAIASETTVSETTTEAITSETTVSETTVSETTTEAITSETTVSETTTEAITSETTVSETTTEAITSETTASETTTEAITSETTVSETTTGVSTNTTAASEISSTEASTGNTTEKTDRGNKGEKTKAGSKKSQSILPRTGEQVVLWMSVAGSILLVALAAFMYLKIKNHNL